MEQVFLDTAGWAFTYPLARAAGCRVASYTHYPTVSADMLVQVHPQSLVTDMLLLEGVERCLHVPNLCVYDTTLDVVLGPTHCRVHIVHGLRGFPARDMATSDHAKHCLKSSSESR